MTEKTMGLTKKHIIRTILFAVLTGALIAADQFVKTLVKTNISYTNGSITVIPNFFEIVHWHNDGGMWGLFPGKVIPLAILASIAAVLLLLFAGCARHWLSQLGLFLILAGAVGNVIDRFKYGYVIDFLSFNFWGYQFPAFNIADSCVVIGAIVMIVFMLFCVKSDTRIFIEGSPMRRIAERAEARKAEKEARKQADEAENEENTENTDNTQK